MKMQNINYTEDRDDDFYDWISDLRISSDITYQFKSDLDAGFSEEFTIDELGLNCDESVVIRSKSLSITNPSHGNVPLSNEIWAIKVGNGYLVTDPIAFSF